MKDAPGLHALILRVAGNDTLAKEQLYAVAQKPLTRHIYSRFGSFFSEEEQQRKLIEEQALKDAVTELLKTSRHLRHECAITAVPGSPARTGYARFMRQAL